MKNNDINFIFTIRDNLAIGFLILGKKDSVVKNIIQILLLIYKKKYQLNFIYFYFRVRIGW